jgi:hypothetical protein
MRKAGLVFQKNILEIFDWDNPAHRQAWLDASRGLDPFIYDVYFPPCWTDEIKPDPREIPLKNFNELVELIESLDWAGFGYDVEPNKLGELSLRVCRGDIIVEISIPIIADRQTVCELAASTIGRVVSQEVLRKWTS